jgi:formylglycine-generating enzyme required for sulfatase activity/tetratricopeptide (TPR) repeat protein
LWNSKPENRHLPSALEWANIRLLTKKRDWNEPQRKMMRRAGRLYGIRSVLILALLAGAVLAGTAVRRQVIENQQTAHGAGLVQRLLDADTSQVPEIVGAMRDYRRWIDPALRSELEKGSAGPRQKLHASLALLPVDASQVDYLFDRLLSATPGELPVLRDALKPHRSTLIPKLWTVLGSAKPGDARLLPSASALASYSPDDGRWEAECGKVAQALVSVNSLLLRPWIEVLHPVRSRLTAPLAAILQNKSRSETVHSLATDILTDYASDDPDRLAELLMVSDPKAFVSLFPVAETRTEQVLPIFLAELGKRATFSWDDPPLNLSWTKPDVSLVSRIESSQGILTERFAFCQTMPLDEFLTTAEGLRRSGYRPTRFRPYADGQVVRVAAVWTRDGRNWRISSGLTSDEARQEDDRNKKDKFLPVDVAGYVTANVRGKLGDRHAALWVEKTGEDDARLYVGVNASEETEVQDKLKDEKLIPRTLHAMIGSDGRTRYCGVWGRPPAASVTGQMNQDQFARNFEQKQADLSDQLLIDVAVSGAGRPRAIRERAQAALEYADKKLKTKPDDLDARFSLAMANLRLGENQKALNDLEVVIEKNPEDLSAKQYRIIALARLGKKQDALTELAKFQKEDTQESSKLYLVAVVAAELGEGADTALETLEAAIRKQPKNADLRYDAARAFSLASRAVSRADKVKGRQLAERCLKLLRDLVKNDDAVFGMLDEDADLDLMREDPTFVEIMKPGRADCRYAAVWDSDATRFEAIEIYGLDPAAHLQKCREPIAQGYRPVSSSVTRTAPEAPLVAVSVWHRPTVQEETKDRLAGRQARAAIGLVRMGKAEEVWALLRHSPDPRLRSFILNWLNPLGVDPKLVASELDRIDPNAKPTPAPGQQRMDAILFHPETSMRRALILALGTYGTEGLSTVEQEPLISKLLHLYRNDPDAGVHSAAEWTLRQWKQQEKVKEVDAQLVKVKDEGERRWFINGEGQAFTVIEGPCEYHMGSPPGEPDRVGRYEHPRRMLVPRRFAISTKEVTAGQFQRFMKMRARSELDQSAEPDDPSSDYDWYTAAAYCNWLSEQEGLPKEQWCYISSDNGAYAEGMTIPTNFLERIGYRLPTESEWEYACRAGAVTSRYYGHSIDLLRSYAWHRANSDDHSWRCGSLLPNELGLFDMLGNVTEWCQDVATGQSQERRALKSGTRSMIGLVIEKAPRLLRGGTYYDLPALLRSSYRDWSTPSSHIVNVGFRPSRTLP